MPGRQLSIARSAEIIPVIELAMRQWPDSRSEADALKRALIRWYYDTQGESRREIAKRTEAKLDRILEILETEHANDFDRA